MTKKHYLHEMIENSNPYFVESRNWEDEKWVEDENGWFTTDQGEVKWIQKVIRAFEIVAAHNKNSYLKNLVHYDDVVEYASFLEMRGAK